MPKLTYANVMSSLGVFLALGGTSYAVARNSIGNRELKSSAVTSGKIRNGTILRKDLSRNAASGPRGPRGQEGGLGATGARGPSDGYVDGGAAVSLSGAANVPVTVAQLDSLPAGGYVLSSYVQAGDFTNGGSAVSCDIRVNGKGVARARAVIGAGPGSVRIGDLSTTAAVTQAAPFAATLECSSDQTLAAPVSVDNPKLSAVRVETAHAT